MPNHNANTEQTLWDRSVKIKNGCWEYSPINIDGYGRMWYKNRAHPAHRLAYKFYNKCSILKNIKVCHSCDNRCCINPDHLFLGTQKDNMDDMTNKGRDRRTGEQNGSSKLTEKQVLRIRKLHKKGFLQKTLAKQFSVDKSSIGFIVNRKTWKHI